MVYDGTNAKIAEQKRDLLVRVQSFLKWFNQEHQDTEFRRMSPKQKLSFILVESNKNDTTEAEINVTPETRQREECLKHLLKVAEKIYSSENDAFLKQKAWYIAEIECILKRMKNASSGTPEIP